MDIVPQPAGKGNVDGSSENTSITLGDRLAEDVAEVSLSQKDGKNAEGARADIDAQTCVLYILMCVPA